MLRQVLILTKAEISRSQIWQWVKHASKLSDGQIITPESVRNILNDEIKQIKNSLGSNYEKTKYEDAVRILSSTILGGEYAEFLTVFYLILDIML